MSFSAEPGSSDILVFVDFFSLHYPCKMYINFFGTKFFLELVSEQSGVARLKSVVTRLTSGRS